MNPLGHGKFHSFHGMGLLGVTKVFPGGGSALPLTTDLPANGILLKGKVTIIGHMVVSQDSGHVISFVINVTLDIED